MRSSEEHKHLEVDVPYLSYEDTAPIADAFLARYHPSGSIPVPLEEIVELKLHIDLFLALGLQGATGLPAALSHDLKKIYVDERMYKRELHRFRSSLAHELGHYVLHRDIARQLSVKSEAEYKYLLQAIPDRSARSFEIQAWNFAGLVLVPEKALHELATPAIGKTKSAGVSLRDNLAVVQKQIAHHIAKHFQVSEEVVKRRLKYGRVVEQHF